MEMQQVRYFLAVSRTLNFTRAAEECNVTQPALTRAIKQLEDELGGELIRREGRFSHLSDLGNRMLPLLRQCYEFDLVVGIDDDLAVRNGPILDVELVRESRFLHYAGTDPAEMRPEEVAAQGVPFDPAHEVDSVLDMEALIVAKFGLAIMPASSMNSPRVRHLPFSALDLKRTVAIYSVAGRARSREAGALLNLLRSTDWSDRITAHKIHAA